MLRLKVAVFKIENGRDVFVAALLSTSHLTADPADANLRIVFRSATLLLRLVTFHCKFTGIQNQTSSQKTGVSITSKGEQPLQTKGGPARCWLKRGVLFP